LREEHRLRAFKNRVLRRILEPRRNEVTGCWGKLHNEELQKLYFSMSIIKLMKSRRVRWQRYVAKMGRRGMHLGYWWINIEASRLLNMNNITR
jgi:hypothetical protein